MIRRLRPGELPRVAGRLATLQQDPTQHLSYLSVDAPAIARELEGLGPAGVEGAVVAVADDAPVGLLAADWEKDPPRVWWHGPFVWGDVDWRTVAEELYVADRGLLPDHVRQEELSPDERSTRVADFALFPGAHLAGSALLDHDRVVLVTRSPAAGSGAAVAGYVAAERQPDGTGYIDILGVLPGRPGRGLGRELVSAAAALLRADLGCPVVALTVREDDAVAASLYRALGFDVERLLRPWRKGFSLQPTGASS